MTGWAIGEDGHTPSSPEREVRSLYDKLEYVILPLFYGWPLGYAEVRRSTIALNGSFFHTQRMLVQYVQNAYRPSGEHSASPQLEDMIFPSRDRKGAGL